MPGGFWYYAQEDPDALAVVDTDGTEVSAGELLAGCNRVAHGLRAPGLEPGDTVAAVLPNGRYPATVYLAALQIGLYYVPINYRLSAPEIAYILQRLATRRRSSPTSASPTSSWRRPTRPASPPTRRFAVGTVAGFRAVRRARSRPARHAARTTAPPARRCTTRRAPPAGPRA